MPEFAKHSPEKQRKEVNIDLGSGASGFGAEAGGEACSSVGMHVIKHSCDAERLPAERIRKLFHLG